MPKMRLTDGAVMRIIPPTREIRQVDYWDELLPSFGLRVSFNGTKAWIILTRILRLGKWTSNRITLGRYPAVSLAEARTRAREALQLAGEGKNPKDYLKPDKARLEAESRNAFGVLADEFLAKYVRRNGLEGTTEKQYRRALKGKDVASWQDRPITSITKRDVLDLLDSIVDRGAPIAANRALAYLRKFFNWCEEREVIERAPTDKLKAPARNRKRERALSSGEIAEVWAAFSAEESLFGSMFKLLLLTGQRRDEVAGMRWDELKNLDGKEAVWELPSHRTKNNLPHLVPLSPQAAAILRGLPRLKDSPFVFTTTGSSYVSGFSKAKTRFDEFVAEARSESQIKEPFPHWTAHDLRRTVSTRMHEDLEIAPHVVEAILNHVSGFKAGVAGNYNRALYLAARREALEKWANHVEQLAKAERTRQIAVSAVGEVPVVQAGQFAGVC